MPAIRPAILRQQSALLADEFDQPDVYLRSLHHLLDQYANRAYRSGQTGKPKPLLEAYDVPLPVLRQLLLDLEPRARQKPDAALSLCQVLWDESYLETRWLAAGLLGKIPTRPERVLTQLKNFLETASNDLVISTLFDHGLAFLRKTYPETIIEQAEKWLASSEASEQDLGLRILLPLAADPGYENLPVLFKLLAPLSCEAPSFVRPDLVDVVKALARRSPRETAFFLRESLGLGICITTAWLTRQVLPVFPAEVQASLRESLRQLM
jgi:hypothetical protein